MSSLAGNEKQIISPAERWLLIRENAYVRTQKRGFVGGNPFKDWLEAEEEIDAKYATDFRCAVSPADPAKTTEQVKSLFAVYGLGDLSVDALLKKHQDGMERLGAFNRTLIDGTSELAKQQASLVQDSLAEAVKTLQSVSQGNMSADGVARQAELSMKAVENALSHVRRLTEAMAGISPGGGKRQTGR
jgi:phasin family protein